MTRSRRSSTSSDSDYGAPIRITKTQVLPIARSHSGRHRHHSPDTVVVNTNSYLQLPGPPRRARASSTSGQPAPVINNFYADDRSRNRSRHRERPDSSGSSDYHRSRSRHRHSNQLPADVLVELTLAERDREDREREKIRKQAVRDAKLREEEDKVDRDRIILEARLKEEHDKRKAEEREKEIVEKYKQKEREKKDKEEQEKKEFDAKYEERVKLEFLAAGYSQSTIESIIKKKKEKERDNRQAIDMARPTFIRVHTKYLSSATLEHFNLPWEYDRVSTSRPSARHRVLTNKQQDPDYIIIKRYISHELQEDLFDHTKNLKNRKLLEAPKARRHSGLGETILSADGSNLFVVKKKTRSKSPARGYFIR
jgi:hypothetical protein